MLTDILVSTACNVHVSEINSMAMLVWQWHYCMLQFVDGDTCNSCVTSLYVCYCHVSCNHLSID